MKARILFSFNEKQLIMSDQWKHVGLVGRTSTTEDYAASKYADVFQTRIGDPIAPEGEYVFVPRLSTAENPPHQAGTIFTMDVFPRCQTDIFWVTIATGQEALPRFQQRWVV